MPRITPFSVGQRWITKYGNIYTILGPGSNASSKKCRLVFEGDEKDVIEEINVRHAHLKQYATLVDGK